MITEYQQSGISPLQATASDSNIWQSAVPEVPEIKIHIFDSLKLGPHSHWQWKQHDVFGPYWRIYWNRTPGAFLKTRHRTVELGPNKIIVMPPDTVYSTWLQSETRHFYVHYSLGQPFSLVKPALFELSQPNLLKLAAETEQIIAERNDYRSMLQLQLYIITTLLALPPQAIPPPVIYDPRIANAITVIETSRLISNSSLATLCNMSTNGFLKLFKTETGLSPQVYSRRKRLHDASIMLHFSNSTIEEIAADTGFCSRYHFSKVFKKEFNIGPAEFRKRHYCK